MEAKAIISEVHRVSLGSTTKETHRGLFSCAEWQAENTSLLSQMRNLQTA